MESIIVSRHPGMIEWLRATRPELANTPVIDTANAADVAGKDVYGIPPLHLAALANSVTVVEFSAAVVRGGMELTAAQMVEAGAKLRTFRVHEAC